MTTQETKQVHQKEQQHTHSNPGHNGTQNVGNQLIQNFSEDMP